MNTVPITVISLFISCAMCVFAAITLNHTLNKDSSSTIKSLVEANVKLDQLCTTTSDIKSDLKRMDGRVNEIDRRLSIVENDVTDLKNISKRGE